MMAALQVDLETRAERLARRVKCNYDLADRGVILKAFSDASKLHAGQVRDSGEPYIFHPLSVAEIVAENGGDQSMVVAALLHDTVEDAGYTLARAQVDYGQEVAQIIDALTAVEAVIPDELRDDEQAVARVKSFFDGLSNAKLVNPDNPQSGKAVYIKLADRLHNMRTISARPPQKRALTAQATQKFFVPLARLIGSRYFEEELSDLCFSVLQHDDYVDVTSAYWALRARNARAIGTFFRVLYEAIGASVSSEGVALFKKTSCSPFKAYSVYNQIQSSGGSLRSISKRDICLYKIELCYQSEDTSCMLQTFLDMYQRNMRKHDVRLRISKSQDKERVGLILNDQFNNSYRVELFGLSKQRPKLDFEALFPRDASITEIPAKSIKVHSKDGREYVIDDGATILDFAFRIHPDIGASALYGLVRSRDNRFNDPGAAGTPLPNVTTYDTKRDLGTVLHEGEYVCVICDKDAEGQLEYHADLSWFNDVRTEYARKRLIELFKKNGTEKLPRGQKLEWDQSKYPTRKRQ